MTRPARAVVTVLLAAALLTGCAQPQARTATAPQDAGGHPVVAAPQAEKIIDTVDRAVVAAETALDARKLGDRAGEPYRSIVAAQYAVARRQAAGTPAPTPTATPSASPGATPTPTATSAVTSRGPFETTRVLAPVIEGWPRFFIAVGSTPAQSTPLIRVLTSADARTPYAVSSDLTMFPGADLPGASQPLTPVPVVAADAPGAVMTPRDVLLRYGDVLSRGAASPFATQFADDLYRRQLATRVDTIRAALDSVATVSTSHAALPDTVRAVALEDGHLLVVGQLSQTLTIKVRSGAGSVTPTPDLAALAGRTTFTKELVRTSVEVVAFVVPPSGVVTAIAAQRADLKVAGS